jgi:aspartyl-tRNA(Asn)/glutamyl-tRNA(Gln) amidotransferase subunit A
VSLAGCRALSWSLDHAGPLARTVEDASLLLSVLAGHDANDPRTRAGSEWDAHRMDGIAALRVGVLGADGTGKSLAENAAMAAWRTSYHALERQGATVTEVDLPEMSAMRAVNLLILSVEAATCHAAGLRTRYRDFGEPCRTRLLAGFAYSATDVVTAQRFRRAVRRRWSAHFQRVDVLSMPSQPDVAPPLGEVASGKFTSPFNALGWPAVSVPFATGPGGLPLATQLVARPWDEATVLRAAYALEESA